MRKNLSTGVAMVKPWPHTEGMRNHTKYTEADAIADSYVSIEEAAHDAACNGWGDGIEFVGIAVVTVRQQDRLLHDWCCSCGEQSPGWGSATDARQGAQRHEQRHINGWVKK